MIRILDYLIDKSAALLFFRKRIKTKYKWPIIIILFFVTGDYMNWYKFITNEGNKLLAHDWTGVKSDFTFLACFFGMVWVMKKILMKMFPFIEVLGKKFD